MKYFIASMYWSGLDHQAASQRVQNLTIIIHSVAIIGTTQISITNK